MNIYEYAIAPVNAQTESKLIQDPGNFTAEDSRILRFTRRAVAEYDEKEQRAQTKS